MAFNITNITIKDFANASILRSNIGEFDELDTRSDASIKFNADLIPSVDNTLVLGNSSNKLNSIYSEDLDVQSNGRIHNIVTDTMVPEDAENITFFGNLLPSLDFTYNIGIPAQRWKQMQVEDIVASNLVSTNNTFVDSTTIIQDNIDGSKKFRFEANTVTTATTRVLTVPDADTTIVGTDVNQIITNKDITGNTNTVGADQLKTTGNSVVINAAAPPIVDQVLAATSPTAATWRNVGDLISKAGGKTLVDFQIATADSFYDITTAQTTSRPLLADNLIDDLAITTNNGSNAEYLTILTCTCATSQASTRIQFQFSINGTLDPDSAILTEPQSRIKIATMINKTEVIGNGVVITPEVVRVAGSGDIEIGNRQFLILGFDDI